MTMAEPYDNLVAEIDRVVNSPYPTQLKGLRDLVCTKCTEGDVSRWALVRPCQIGRLVECLLDGLRQWPYVLELLTGLAQDVSIRNAVLEQYPAFLHDIISHAIKVDSADSKYVAGAVTFLSHPLPEHTTMPAEAQTLFIRQFDQAAEEPSLPNLRRVYHILKGTSSLLLGLLSSSSLHRLEEHLFDILRNNKGENQSLSLYCLAIIKMTACESKNDFCNSNSQYDTQELLASTQLASTSRWTPETMQQFFTDTKAQKTVQLVVLRAMLACTVSTSEPFDERMESLLLANEVVAAVAPHLREIWRKANSLVVGKLQDKVMSPSLEAQLKYQGYLFLAQVTEGSRVPATIMDNLRGIVVDPVRLRLALCGASSGQIGHLMDAGVFDENTVTTLLQQTVDFVTSSSNEQHWLETLSCLQSLSDEMYAAMASDTKLSEGSMLALDVISCGRKLHKLRDLVRFSDEYACNGSGSACAAANQRACCKLVHSLSRLFLRAALSSPHQSYSASQETVTLLLELHASTGSPSVKCSHTTPPSKRAIRESSFVEETNTPDEAAPRWRDALSHHVQSRARTDEDRLTSVFAKACAELEARCEGIEMPLREERDKREMVERQYKELQQSYNNLEAENADRSIRFNAMEMERDQYINDLESQRDEVEGHERRIEELLETLQQAREDAERSTREVQSNAEAARLEHAASSATKDEELEELQDQVQRTECELEEKANALRSFGEQMEQLQSSLAQAKIELESARLADEERQNTIAALEREKGEAVARAEEVSVEMRAARDDAIAQREAFERDLSDMRQRAELDLETASSECEERIADLTRQYDANAETLRKQLAEAQEDISQAREQHRLDIEQWEAEIGERQKKIDRLTRKCSDKNKQIAEANSMRTNLMAAMGISGGAAPPQNGQNMPHRPSRSSALQRTQYSEADSQQDPSPPTPLSGDDTQQPSNYAADASFASNATSSSESRSGPTPKRPRPRRSIKPASPAKPAAARMSTSTRSGARDSLVPVGKIRQPLLGVSGNASKRSASERGPVKTPSKGLGIEGLEEEFGGSEIFEETLGFGEGVGVGFDGEETETGL